MNAKTRRARAVILAGGPGSANFPLANTFPLLTFPMANRRTLIDNMLDFLVRVGIQDVAICVSSQGNSRQAISDAVNAGPHANMNICWAVDEGFRGTAGPLKDLASFINGDPFLVVGPNLWLHRIDLPGILATHEHAAAAATVVIQPQPSNSRGLENVALTEDGQVKEFLLLHQSRDHRREMRPAGMYVFEPEVLDAIDPDGYVDIKEQLIPTLRERDQRVRAHLLDAPVQQIDSLEAYFMLCRRELMQRWSAERVGIPDLADSGDGIYVGANVHISPDAILVGPLTIEDDCIIDSGSRVVGPGVICRGTHIAADALIRESILWRNCTVEEGARVEYSVITTGCTISRKQQVMSTVVAVDTAWNSGINGATLPAGAAPKRRRTQDRDALQRTLRLGRWACYRACKRSLDIAVSALLLLMLMPLFVLIAIAIKFDSRGPVFFSQFRCGVRGRPFRMYKFRTMLDKAEQLQRELHDDRDTKGPMFKMQRDPRITRLGHILRKTSVDELPQLWNVLKGDMSLVGPRPLAMDEMAWSTKWRDIRLTVRPGITGLWQVNARDDPAFNSWLENDLDYVEHQSLLMDLKILLKTAQAVINRSTSQ